MRQSGLWFEHNIVANQQTTQPQLDQKMQLIKIISLLSQHLANLAKTLAETKLSIVQGKDNQYSMPLNNKNTSPFIEIKPSLNESLPSKPQIANYLIAQSQKPTVTTKLINFTNTPATLVNPIKSLTQDFFVPMKQLQLTATPQKLNHATVNSIQSNASSNQLLAINSATPSSSPKIFEANFSFGKTFVNQSQSYLPGNQHKIDSELLHLIQRHPRPTNASTSATNLMPSTPQNQSAQQPTIVGLRQPILDIQPISKGLIVIKVADAPPPISVSNLSGELPQLKLNGVTLSPKLQPEVINGESLNAKQLNTPKIIQPLILSYQAIWPQMMQHLTTNKPSENNIERLVRHLFSGLLRIQGHQLESIIGQRDNSPTAPQQNHWQFDLPLHMGDKYVPVNIDIYQYQDKDKTTSRANETSKAWGLRMSFELGELGELTIDAGLKNHALSMSMWLTNESAMKRAKQGLNNLIDRLREAGLHIEDIHCHQGIAPATNPKNHILDTQI